MALFGRNGAGKSNLLECLGIQFGTEQTTKLMLECLGSFSPTAHLIDAALEINANDPGLGLPVHHRRAR